MHHCRPHFMIQLLYSCSWMHSTIVNKTQDTLTTLDPDSQASFMVHWWHGCHSMTQATDIFTWLLPCSTIHKILICLWCLSYGTYKPVSGTQSAYILLPTSSQSIMSFPGFTQLKMASVLHKMKRKLCEGSRIWIQLVKTMQLNSSLVVLDTTERHWIISGHLLGDIRLLWRGWEGGHIVLGDRRGRGGEGWREWREACTLRYMVTTGYQSITFYWQMPFEW